MSNITNLEAVKSNRRFVLADNLRPRVQHGLQKTESNFGQPTPATRHHDGRDAGMTPDPELQDAIKNALAGFKG